MLSHIANWTLVKKLRIAASVVVAIIVVLGVMESQRFGQMQERFEELITRVEANELTPQQAQAAARVETRGASTRILGAISVILFFTVILVAVIPRTMVSTLNRTMQALEAVAQGDLTQRLDIETQDEAGRMARALDQAVTKMRSTLREIVDAAHDTARAAIELSTASNQLSTSSQEQASTLEETAASLEEMTGTVKQNADNALQANQLALGTRKSAEEGGQIVSEMLAASSELNASSQKIADITSMIDEIAFQTNLLALNAAVEAARAGEQGRGFAVVAAEVRNLAQRSATAAKDIKNLLQDSDQKMRTGSDRVTRSGQALEEIIGSVTQVTDLMGDITAANQEQSVGIDQVNKAVAQMDQIVQNNSAQTEQLSSTAQSLTTQAERLRTLVGQFRVSVDEPAERHSAQSLPISAPVLQTPPRVSPVHTSVMKDSAYRQEHEFEEF